MRTCIGLWKPVIFEISKQPENFPQATVKLVDLLLTRCSAVLSGS